VAAEHLDEPGQGRLVHDPLPGGGGVELHDVDGPLELGVLAGHGAHRVRQVLPEARRLRADLRPTGFLREVEANELVVLLDELLGVVAPAELVGQLFQLVLEDVREAL